MRSEPVYLGRDRWLIGSGATAVESRPHRREYAAPAYDSLGRPSQLRELVKCPFCGVGTVVSVWSICGAGKRCRCGALLLSVNAVAARGVSRRDLVRDRLLLRCMMAWFSRVSWRTLVALWCLVFLVALVAPDPRGWWRRSPAPARPAGGWSTVTGAVSTAAGYPASGAVVVGSPAPALSAPPVSHQLYGRVAGWDLRRPPALLVSIEPADLVTVARRGRGPVVLKALPDGSWERVR